MVATKLYVEGGGDSNALRTRCREGFSMFLEKAGLEGRMPRIVACGTRGKAYDHFCTALRQRGSGEFVVLLVDSEEPVPPGAGPWKLLSGRTGDKWDKPAGAADDDVHLMVQCMEAWFLADKDALARYYGQEFTAAALPANPNPEQIPKDDVLRGLENATRHTQKGKYSHGTPSFQILALIDPSKVENASPHASRFLDHLLNSPSPETCIT